MANTIRIKRRASGNSGAPSSLANAELAYNEVDDVLYYGKGTGGIGGTATTIPAIGGPGAFMTLSTNQSITGTKNFTEAIITVPTKTQSDNSNNAASTAYVDTAVGSISPTFAVAGNSGSFTFRTGSVLTIQGDGTILSSTSAQPSGNNVTLSFSIANSSITNAKLANNSITIGTTSVSLGGSSTTLSGLTTITGSSSLTLSANGTNSSIYLSPTGTGSVDIANKKITNLASPVSDSDAANKGYVDNAISGLSWKQSANLLAISNINLTGSSGTLTIDGHSALGSSNTGYRLLLVAQNNSSENGIYIYSDNGITYSLVRSSDADTYQELIGASIYIVEGTTYSATGWVQSNHYLSSFSGQQWVQFSGSGAYLAGNGLTLTGKTFDVVGTANRIIANADSIDIASNYIGQTSITTLGTITSGTWNATTISVDKGGTGLTSYAVGDILYASTSSVLSKLAAVATGNVLISQGTGTAPAWGKVDLTSAISGTLPVGNGGTGITTATTNGIIYGNGSSAFGVTSAGTWDSTNSVGQILSVNSSGVPTWTNTVDGGTF